MHTKSLGKWGVLALGWLAAASACRDGGVVQPEDAASDASRPLLWHGGNPHEHGGNDTATVVFFIDPSTRTTQPVGAHKVAFPKLSVCDPNTSSYGSGTWDSPCKPANYPIKVTAKSWLDKRNHPYIEFSPELRFVPSKTVTLYMKDKRAVMDPDAVIVYCGPDGKCIDEAATDPSLETFVDSNGFLYRRIKHFSGYNVAAGRSLNDY